MLNPQLTRRRDALEPAYCPRLAYLLSSRTLSSLRLAALNRHLKRGAEAEEPLKSNNNFRNCTKHVPKLRQIFTNSSKDLMTVA
eukprot:2148115-Rhodomonas_salina.1